MYTETVKNMSKFPLLFLIYVQENSVNKDKQ